MPEICNQEKGAILLLLDKPMAQERWEKKDLYTVAKRC